MLSPFRSLVNANYHLTRDSLPSENARLAAEQYYLEKLAEIPEPAFEEIHTPISPYSPVNEPVAGQPPLRPIEYALFHYNQIERVIDEGDRTFTIHADPAFAPVEAPGPLIAADTSVEYRWAQEGLPTDQWSLDGTSESRVFNFPPRQ